MRIMEFVINRPVKVQAKWLNVEAGVRYWEDGKINGIEDAEDSEEAKMPCKEGDVWCPCIDIDTGIIVGWPAGIAADIHYKVCDDGKYTITDAAGQELLKKEGYVPDCMSPGGNGYGDYIIMKIDGSGKIENWNPNFEDFKE